MGTPSYMRSVVDRNVVMRRIPVYTFQEYFKSYFFACTENMKDAANANIVPETANMQAVS